MLSPLNLCSQFSLVKVKRELFEELEKNTNTMQKDKYSYLPNKRTILIAVPVDKFPKIN